MYCRQVRGRQEHKQANELHKTFSKHTQSRVRERDHRFRIEFSEESERVMRSSLWVKSAAEEMLDARPRPDSPSAPAGGSSDDNRVGLSAINDTENDRSRSRYRSVSFSNFNWPLSRSSCVTCSRNSSRSITAALQIQTEAVHAIDDAVEALRCESRSAVCGLARSHVGGMIEKLERKR